MRGILIIAALLAAPDPDAAWTELWNEYQTARQEFWKEWREAKKLGASAPKLDYSKHPDRTFVPRFKALAESHPGTEAAAQCWAQVARLGATPEEKGAAVEILLESHIGSRVLQKIGVTLRLMRGDKAEAWLWKIAEKSPHAEVRGFALLYLGQLVKESRPSDALEIFRMVKEKYGEVASHGTGTLGAKADSEIFEATHLVVGKVAPDIEGEDTDGLAFKLSDYRGKVVLLDFWGDW